MTITTITVIRWGVMAVTIIVTMLYDTEREENYTLYTMMILNNI